MGLNINITVSRANADSNSIKLVVESLLKSVNGEKSNIVISRGLQPNK